MGTRIEVMTRGDVNRDSDGLILQKPLKAYNIDDRFTNKEIVAIEELLADPIVDITSTNRSILRSLHTKGTIIEKSPKPGVNDPEGKETQQAIERILGRGVGPVSIAEQHIWRGELNEIDYVLLQKQIGNPLIHDFIRVDGDKYTLDGVGFHFPYVDLPKVPAFEYVNIVVGAEELSKLSDGMML